MTMYMYCVLDSNQWQSNPKVELVHHIEHMEMNSTVLQATFSRASYKHRSTNGLSLASSHISNLARSQIALLKPVMPARNFHMPSRWSNFDLLGRGKLVVCTVYKAARYACKLKWRSYTDSPPCIELQEAIHESRWKHPHGVFLNTNSRFKVPRYTAAGRPLVGGN